MEDKKIVRISLGTSICIFIIIILIVALGVVYYLGYVKNNQEILELKNEINSLKVENNTIIENETSKVETNKERTENSNESIKEDLSSITAKCKENYELYLKIADASNTGYAFIDALKVLGLAENTTTIDDYELIKSDGFEYYKTNIKYSDLKDKMLELETEEYFNSHSFIDGPIIVKNDIIYLQTLGSSGLDSKLTKFELESNNNNSYIFKATTEFRDDGPGYDIYERKVYFVKENNKFLLNKIELLDRQAVDE